MANARKHVTPAGSDSTVNRATIFDQFGNSIHDIVPVANTTERTQLINSMSAAGYGPSAENPVTVHRVDAPGLHRIETTVDGTVWIPASGVLTFTTGSEANSWAVANGAYLRNGDRASIGGTPHRWLGRWVPETGVRGIATTQSGNQSVDNNTTTVLTLTGGFADGGVAFADAVDTFTVPIAGWYRIEGYVKWSANPNGHRALGFQINATGDADEVAQPASPVGATGQSFTAYVSLAAGNTVKMIALQTSGGPLNAGARRLAVELIR